MANSTSKCLYFALSSYWNVQLSYGKPWLPRSLGGTGTETFSTHHPYSENFDLRTYQTVTMGYHVAQLLATMLETDK